MGLTARDSIIYVADWFNVEIYRFGEGLQRDIDINFTQIDMGDVMTGNTVDTVFEVFNTVQRRFRRRPGNGHYTTGFAT
jgi:hypothetical protein